MKSAYELAMERFKDEGDSTPLSDAQKQELADLDQRHRAKLAEREVSYQEKIQKARSGGKQDEVRKLAEEFDREKKRLEAELEDAKERVRRAK